MATGKLIAIVGETASGKSALALDVAERYNGELICADSWTVRRDLDIGTAKPSAEEQLRVRHHLLDVVGPAEDYSAAIFKRQALAVIDDITGRDKLPILVGGTGLYIDGILYNYDFLPPAEDGIRESLSALTIEQLLAKIQADGIKLGETDIRNKRRLIRLLETDGAAQTKSTLRSNTLILGLQPDRDQLKERIERRTDTMLAAGLEQEVSKLARTYGWEAEGLKGIGYREWREYFQGSQNLEITRQRIISSTVGLAKRQRTWFKRNKSVHWITTPVNYTQVDDLITTFMHN